MRNKLPLRFWLGLLLIVIFWYLNWALTGLRTHWAFFPLWLGFALTVDALVFLRKGSSLFSRNKLAYIGLFFLSIPVWWLFELFNSLTQNWQYWGREHFTDFEFFIYASLNFSTVIPVVFGASDPTRGYRKFAPQVLHPKTEVTGGVLATECSELMQEFFKLRR